MKSLPIESVFGDLKSAYARGARNFVVSAPTGSGKSTRLPAMLAEMLGGGKILVLEPRRVAARMLAKSVVKLFGLDPDYAGWHVRMERHFTRNTKIVFLTEAILARMLLSGDFPKDVKAVVFDEFHERNIYADISLALAMRRQRTADGDLAVFVCSASMDCAKIAAYLGEGCVTLSCQSRTYPIDIRYMPPRSREATPPLLAAAAIESLIPEADGANFLVFMPGIYEINRTVAALLKSPAIRGYKVMKLYGDLSGAEQDRILEDSESPKIIVATNVAETSLTVEGVRYVVDSGLAKVARFDVSRGVNTVLTERISLANAVQRAGRAGRTAPGVAVRLWKRDDEVGFPRFIAPEIERIDLSQILLWLKAAGMDFCDLDMFEPPRAEAVASSAKTLANLGALEDGAITPIGRAMAAFPSQPRISRMLIEGARRGCLEEVSLMAAVQEAGKIRTEAANAFAQEQTERLAGDVCGEPHFLARLVRLAHGAKFDEDFCRRNGIHSANSRRAFFEARELYSACTRFVKPAAESADMKRDIALSVLSAFSDMLGVRLNAGTYACALSGGKSGEISKQSRQYAPAAGGVFAAMSIAERNRAQGAGIVAELITPIGKEWLGKLFPTRFCRKTTTVFDASVKRVVGLVSESFGDLKISSVSSASPDLDEAARILTKRITDGQLVLKNFDDDARNFITRVNFLSRAMPEYEIPAINGDALNEIFFQMCYGKTAESALRDIPVMPFLREWLSASQLELLRRMLPVGVEFPNRHKPCRIEYSLSPLRAVIAAPFRDFYNFEWRKVRICDGRIKPTFTILAPNRRPVQTTQDLDEFWRTSWQTIRRELKARYPKHFKDEPSFV